MEYHVEQRNMEEIRVAFTKYRGDVRNANKVFPLVFQSIRGNNSAAPFFAYYELNVETKEGVMELCVPTEMEPEKNGVEIKIIPTQKALVTTHVGSYETIIHAYEAIQEYATKNNIELALPYREVYIKGPGMIFKGNPDHYITEVVFPIKES